MNVKLLRKVAKHISEEPKRLAMSTWVQKSSDRPQVTEWGKSYSFPKCGTAACIAGWACILSGEEYPHSLGIFDNRVQEKAIALLNLGIGQEQKLFGVGFWPMKFNTAYNKAKTHKARAKAAVARIEHFIKTKGKE